MALAEADYGLTDMAHSRPGNAQNRFRGDDHLFVEFYSHPRLSRSESERKGRPIYKDTDYVRIMVPGDKESIVERPASEQDKRRFPRQYEAYRQNQEAIVEGTPLTEWSGISNAQAKELEFFGIRTVDHLAELADSKVQGVMGGSLLKKRAQEYINLTAADAPLQEATTKIENLEGENKALRESLEAMRARLDALEADAED